MIALSWLVGLGCGAGATGGGPLEPEPIGLQECAVCGMLVGEQPAPRGQLAYRGGEHALACGIEELRALVAAPSPKGTPVAVWVEVLPPGFDPAGAPVDPLPWLEADAAWYVFGAERGLVMGVPVLTYAAEAPALASAMALGTRPVRWGDLVGSPVPEVPVQAGWSPSAGAGGR